MPRSDKTAKDQRVYQMVRWIKPKYRQAQLDKGMAAQGMLILSPPSISKAQARRLRRKRARAARKVNR